MKTRFGFFALTLAVAVLSASVAKASTITAEFKFFNNGDVVANGSFSYDSLTSGLLKFSDLSAFSISGAGNSYSLADITGPGATLTSANYFGYNTTSNSFIPAVVNGPLTPGGDPLAQYLVIFSAVAQTATDLSNGLFQIDTLAGFQFDPLASQSDPEGLDGYDGLYAFYSPPNCGDCQVAGDFPSFTGFLVTPIPEPSTWVMMLVGFLGLGFAAYRRKTSAMLEIA